MKRIIPLLLLVVIAINIFGQQQILFDQKKNESYLVQHSNDLRAKNINKILDKIASTIPKSVYQTKFSFSYTQELKITKSGNQIKFLVDFSNINLNGDIFYKGIPMVDVLLPKNLDLKINWIANINQVLNTYKFDKISLTGNPINVLTHAVIDTFNYNGYKMEVLEKSFFYNADNILLFDAKCLVVDDYYNTDSQMQLAYSELQSIDPNNLDMLFQYKNITDKNQAFLNSIAAKKFPEKLNLNDNDPANFMQKYSDLHQFNAQLSIEINNTIQNLHQIYYTRGLEALSENNMNAAKMFFNKAVNSNLMFAPAHYQLAKIDYNEKSYDLAIQRIKDILYKMQADPNTQNLCNELANKIYSDHILAAENLLNKSYFDQAIEKLDFAQSVCQSISGVFCGTELSNNFSKAYKGKISEYCSKAEKAIQVKAFKDAESLIETAIILRNSRSNYLSGDTQIDILLQKLYNAYVSDGNELITKQDYNEALDRFYNAKSTCDKYNSVNCTESLFNGIKIANSGIYQKLLSEANSLIKAGKTTEAEQVLNNAINHRNKLQLEKDKREDEIIIYLKQTVYTQTVSQGKEFANSKLYYEALHAYDNAKYIEGNYTIKPDINLNKYIDNCARAVVFLEISNGESAVLENNLGKARIHYKKAKDNIEKYELANQNDISSAMIKLKDQIFTQECKNIQAEYDGYIEKAMSSLKNLKYISANNWFNKCIELSEKNPDCEIATTNAKNKKQEILAGVIYQNKLNEIKDILKKGKHTEVIEKYIEAEQYYNGNNVASLNLKHIPLFNFIKNSNKPRFINDAVHYYTIKTEFDKALKLLDELKNINYNYKITRGNQSLLGTKLAIKDHSTDPQGISKNLVLKYTNNEKWYKYLKKAYLKQWKALK